MHVTVQRGPTWGFSGNGAGFQKCPHVWGTASSGSPTGTWSPVSNRWQVHGSQTRLRFPTLGLVGERRLQREIVSKASGRADEGCQTDAMLGNATKNCRSRTHVQLFASCLSLPTCLERSVHLDTVITCSDCSLQCEMLLQSGVGLQDFKTLISVSDALGRPDLVTTGL